MNRTTIQISVVVLYIINILFLGFSGGTVASDSVIQQNNALYDQRLDGTVLYVGGSGLGNYSKIQDAIDNATDGDTVFVFDDSSPYYERLRVNKSLTLIGENKETTIIDGNLAGTVITLTAPAVMIEGFTIQHGLTGIVIQSADNVIQWNIIRENNAYNGLINWQQEVSGIKLNALSHPVENNNISHNSLVNNFIGCYIKCAEHNTFYQNTILSETSSARRGIMIQENSPYNTLDGNIIDSIDSSFYGILIAEGSDYTCIRNNTLLNTQGITITDANNLMVENNLLEEFGASGIGFTRSSNTLVSKNTIVEGAGIAFNQCDNTTVSENILTGNNHQNIGLSFDTCANLTITSNSVRNYLRGLILITATGCIAKENQLENNRLHGIYLYKSENNSIENNEVSGSEIGLCLEGNWEIWIKNNSIQENNVFDNDVGIELVGAQFNLIDGNLLQGNKQGIINRWESSYNTINHNTFGDHTDHGIILQDSSYVEIIGNTFTHNGISIRPTSWHDESVHWCSHTIENNMVNGKPIYYYKNADNIVVPSDAAQVIVAGCTNVLLNNLEITQIDLGIEIGFCSNVRITNNTLTNIGHSGITEVGHYGILLLLSSDILMKNNIIERADDAIYIRFCSQTTINGNIIRNNRNSGISIISESYHNSIVDNTITNNNRYGIYLSWLVDNNTISKNTITGHSMGMQLSYLRDNIFCQNTLQDNNVGIFDEPNILIYWTQNNQFYHNNFINNELHATDYTENIWDDGYPSGGNYWDDYTGVDENADGIGDTAYPVYPGINEDRYPLMTPHQITDDLQIIIHKGFGLGVSAEITVLQSLPEETINWSIELRKGLILFPLKRTKEGSFSTPQVSESKKISTLVFGLGRIEIAVTAQTISKTANGFVLGPFVFVHGANEDPNESNDPLMIGENLIHHLKGD